MQEGYRGFFFDAIDSFTLTEKLVPSIDGAARAAGAFLEEILPSLRGMGSDAIVNGGLYATKSTTSSRLIGRCGAGIAAEHQYTDGKGHVRPAKDASWTRARLTVFATAAASGATPHVSISSRARSRAKTSRSITATAHAGRNSSCCPSSAAFRPPRSNTASISAKAPTTEA
ncbi:MAG: hypothetical protein WDN72_11045 [Alphaproteobacteria bacterium]